MPRAGIGTARVVQLYQPPDIRRISEDAAKRYQDPEKKLDPGMWHIRTWRLFGSRGRYRTELLMKDKSGWLKVGLPTDKTGKIPLELLAARLMDTSSGDRSGRDRNVMVDLAINAKSMGPFTDKTFSYRWYLHPNEHDIVSIDDVNSKIVTIIEKTKAGNKRSLIITGGTQAQQKSIAEAIKTSFTVREKRILAGTLIQIKKLPKGVAGYFQGHTDAEGKPMGVPIIGIDPKHALNSDVVIHEVIHDLRQFDVKRPSKLRAVKHYRGRDADLEESLTEAETVARQKPLTKHTNTAGYYNYIRVSGKTVKSMIVEDRVTITEPKDPGAFITSGKKGVRAQKKVLKNYPATNIAHMKLHGDTEAIDTFYKLENQGIHAPKQQVHIQIYSPKGGKAQDERLDKRMKQHGRMKVGKWDDGQLKSLHKPTKSPSPRPSPIPPSSSGSVKKTATIKLSNSRAEKTRPNLSDGDAAWKQGPWWIIKRKNGDREYTKLPPKGATRQDGTPEETFFARGPQPPGELTHKMGAATAEIDLNKNPRIGFVQAKTPDFKVRIPPDVKRQIGLR